MENKANFNLTLSFIEAGELAHAGVSEEYRNPLLTWIKLVFADDKPNANKQGICQSEFTNLIKSMSYMPIKANYSGELEGHSNASIIGVIQKGQQEGNRITAVGALYNDENPDVVEFFRNETAAGRAIDFSWEIRYKDADVKDGVEWLTGTTAKAITAVKNPAYEGRTGLVSISDINLFDLVREEMNKRLIPVEVA
jgi:hypothetical protein